MEARRSQSSTDGRRRRLLANRDTSDLLEEFQSLAPQKPAATVERINVSTVDRQILHRMVSGQLWKHCFLIAAVLVLAFTAVWSEIHPPKALQTMVISAQPRISQGLAGAFLLMAGQLSLLIAWIRSCSSVDFSGRYRCWKWLAGSLIIIGGLWVTNTQDSLPQLAAMFVEPLIGTVDAAQRTLVVVPVAGLSIWILGRVLPDMGRNRWSQTLFALGVLAAFSRLLLSWGMTPGFFSAPVLDGVLLSATGLLVCALLLHTRFVLYVCADPPDQHLSRSQEMKQPVEQSENGQPERHKPPTTVAAPDTSTEELRGKENPERGNSISDNDESTDVIPADWAESDRKSRRQRQNKRRRKKAA